MEVGPKHFTHDHQPYGTIEMEDAIWTPITADATSELHVKYCAEKGLGVVTGTVSKGGETSRILHHQSFRSMVGEKYHVWAVSQDEFIRGHKITVAM